MAKEDQADTEPDKNRGSVAGGHLKMGDKLPNLDGASLTPVQSIKSLGVILVASLNMEGQVTNISKVAIFSPIPSTAFSTFPVMP